MNAPPRVEPKEISRTNNVRVEQRAGPNRRRYWDPSDGRWTHPLQDNASMERFYTRVKGFLLEPPGPLAIYVNPVLRDNRDPAPRIRAERIRRAYDGPFPTGLKDTACNCGSNCDNWEQHYEKLGLEFDHWLADEVEDSMPTRADFLELQSMIRDLRRANDEQQEVIDKSQELQGELGKELARLRMRLDEPVKDPEAAEETEDAPK